MVNETDNIDLSVPNQVNLEVLNANTIKVNRIFRFAYSTEMQNYLIKKFRLYTYYQIDSLSPFAYAKVIEKLSGRISLKNTSNNFIDLTVKDRDRHMPAAMANEIAAKLNIINEAFIKRQLKKKIGLYEELYLDIKKDMERNQDKMNSLIANFSALINSLEKNKVQTENLKYALIDLSNSLNSRRDEMIKTRQFFEIILKTLEKEPLETITVVNRALPDHHSNVLKFILISLGAAIWMFCLMIVLLYAYLKHQKYIQLIFKG